MLSDKSILRSTEHGNSELSRIDYLDGWRGLAIGFVLVSHFFLTDSNLARFGVDIFFVLSGLLMSKILFVKRVGLVTFYKRRFSRVFPVFTLFILYSYGSAFLFDLSNEYQNVFYTLSFTRTYFPVEQSIWNTGLPVGHLWSLNVEEHSYVILSLITLISLFKYRESWVLLILGFAAIILQIYYVKLGDLAPTNYELHTEIAASHLFLSAGYFLICHRFEKFIKGWMPIAALLIALFLYTKSAPWYASWLISPILLAFSVNHLDKTYGFFKDVLNFIPLRLLGIWSFSIYLWQQPFYYWVKYSPTFAYSNWVGIVAAVLLGVSSFYLFENPIRRWLNQNW